MWEHYLIDEIQGRILPEGSLYNFLCKSSHLLITAKSIDGLLKKTTIKVRVLTHINATI